MNESLSKLVINGLNGLVSHIDPMKAMNGLNPENAKKKVSAELHSCWDLIHHIVIWQEAVINAIIGNVVNWGEIEKNNNWPDPKLLEDGSNFKRLLKKFRDDLENAKQIAGEIDLTKELKNWAENTALQAFGILFQHNSYHIGQLVTTRKNLGLWP